MLSADGILCFLSCFDKRGFLDLSEPQQKEQPPERLGTVQLDGTCVYQLLFGAFQDTIDRQICGMFSQRKVYSARSLLCRGVGEVAVVVRLTASNCSLSFVLAEWHQNSCSRWLDRNTADVAVFDIAESYE